MAGENSSLPVGTTFWKISSHNIKGGGNCKTLLHFTCKISLYVET